VFLFDDPVAVKDSLKKVMGTLVFSPVENQASEGAPSEPG
jgi:hypothetical protein